MAKRNPRIQTRKFKVSARTLLGRKSQMDKTIEKWESKGWTLVNDVNLNGKYKHELTFQYHLSDDEYRREQIKGFGCLALIAIVIFAALTNRSPEPTITTPATVTFWAIEAATKKSVAQATERQVALFETATATLWTATFTATVTNTPTITYTPSNTFTPTNTATITNTPQSTDTLPPPTTTNEPRQNFYAINNTNVRECPRIDCAVVDKIVAGEKVSVVGRQGNWYLVDLSGAKSGYIRSDLLSKSDGIEIAVVSTLVTTRTIAPTAFKYLGNEAQDVELIKDYLNILTDNRRIVSVKVANGRASGGERVAIIAYVTTENSDIGYLDEMFDIFEALYEAVDYYQMDLDSITLVGGDQSGNTAGAISVSIPDVLDYFEGRTSKQEFVAKWITTSF